MDKDALLRLNSKEEAQRTSKPDFGAEGRVVFFPETGRAVKRYTKETYSRFASGASEFKAGRQFSDLKTPDDWAGTIRYPIDLFS